MLHLHIDDIMKKEATEIKIKDMIELSNHIETGIEFCTSMSCTKEFDTVFFINTHEIEFRISFEKIQDDKHLIDKCLTNKPLMDRLDEIFKEWYKNIEEYNGIYEIVYNLSF